MENKQVLMDQLYQELEHSLPKSNAVKRKIWADLIIREELDLKHLSNLLRLDPKIATRFLWLLSEIGTLSANKLLKELPYLLDLCTQLNPVYQTSFANYWLLVGVPIEQEAKAIDLLFHWLLSNESNVTLKSRSILVLYHLSKKYPEIKNELKICLEDQMDKYSVDFQKRAEKILRKMNDSVRKNQN
jgi:hypothetical protein